MEVDQCDEAVKLKALIGELEERIYNLRLFDKASEVDAHCDDLIGQVTLNIESAVNRLNKLQDEMIKRINNYRNTLLEVGDASERASEDVMILYSKGTSSQLAEASDRDEELHYMIETRGEIKGDVDVELDRLSKEITSFAQKTSREVTTADELKTKVQRLRIQMRERAFKGVFMRFNETKTLHGDFPGRLEYGYRDPETARAIRHVTLDDCVQKASILDMSPLKATNSVGGFANQEVKATLFLRDESIAVAIPEHPIFVWSLKTGQKMFEMRKAGYHMPAEFAHENFPMPLAQLPSGHLVSGDSESLDVWDLENRRHLKTFFKSKRAILSLNVLPNGDLVAFDGHIYVWKLGNKGVERLFSSDFVKPSVTIKPHENLTAVADSFENCGRYDRGLCFFSQQFSTHCSSGEELDVELSLEVLANGQLLASSVLRPDAVAVHYHNSSDGKHVKGFELRGSNIDHCKILPSGDVVLCLSNGIVQIYDYESSHLYQSFSNEQRGLVLDIKQQADGSLLFVHLDDLYLPLLKPDQHKARPRRYVKSVCVSNDGQRVAVGSAFGRVVVWSLKD